MSTEIERQLIQDEGKVRFAYKDSLGFLTIGVGFLIDKARGGGLDDDEIAFILQHRIDKRSAAVKAAWPWTQELDEVRYGVLINMSYQLGVSGVGEFHHFLTAMQVSDWETASKEMLDSEWAKQTPARAHRLAKQITTGVWQWL